MEFGKSSLNGIKQAIQHEDLDVSMKVGMVLTNFSFGSAVALRDTLRKEKVEVVYYTIASTPLYVVKWNDLSPEKQQEITRRREKHERERRIES